MTPTIDINNLTSEQKDARDDYGYLFAQEQGEDWDIGKLTSTLAVKWEDGGAKAFYNQVVKPTFGDRAPQYGTVMLYRRVAENWNRVVAVSAGTSLLAKVWTWYWAQGLDPYQTNLENVQITFADPKTGKEVTKNILEATEVQIQDAINELAAGGNSSVDLSEWPVVGVTQKTLEKYKKGASRLLVTRQVLSKDSLALGFRPIDVDDFATLIVALATAIRDAGLVMSDAAGGRQR
jgi:hypothetical protein